MSKSAKVSYQDVRAIVLRRIRDNTWAPGTIIPGEVALAQELGCARATVNRAMRELANEGILDRKPKAGTRVRISPVRQAKFNISLIREEIENAGANYRYALIMRELPETPNWLRARLSLQSDTRVMHLQCLHYAGNLPFQFEDRWINLNAVPKAEEIDFNTIGPNDWLVSEVPFTDAELAFSATSATDPVSELMEVSQGSPLFTIERRTWLETTTITYTKLYFHAGYKMTTHV